MAVGYTHAENKWGKLPITIYDKDYSGKMVIQNMEYDTPPGRSYRYYTGRPLFPFGWGLSLTTFSHSCACKPSASAASPTALEAAVVAAAGSDLSCSCTLKNTGARAGDEVIMAYDALSPGIRSGIGKAFPVPLKRLVAFERTTVAAGATATVGFSIPITSLTLTTASGAKELFKGTHNLIFSRGDHADDVTVPVVIA